jgi:Kef-type K+ transport system membrane component KefB
VDDLTRGIDTLVCIAVVAALAPFVAAMIPGNRVPQVVVLILGGVLLGPQVSGLAVAIFLGTSSSLAAALSLAIVGAVAAAFTLAPRIIRNQRAKRILLAGEHATSQTTLRWTVVLLLALLAFAERFGLDIVLGAFVAGIVLRQWSPGDVKSLEEKLDAVGYGFFIPVFFVSSGMALDVRSIAAAPLRLLVFFLLLLVFRGLPALLVYRRALPPVERIQMVFITATTLPMLVALAHIGLDTKTMLPENAAALVGAGVLSVCWSSRRWPSRSADARVPIREDREVGELSARK